MWPFKKKEKEHQHKVDPLRFFRDLIPCPKCGAIGEEMCKMDSFSCAASHSERWYAIKKAEKETEKAV
jgi:hypothetical protein